MQPVRGTHDLLPDAYALHSHIVDTAQALANLFGYQGIATPILEFKEVFQRSVGDTSDIVMKEMYRIAKRTEDADDVVLRPEGTAAVVRALLSNSLTQSLPLKFFYTGAMFRYDRPQKGRLREFHQLGVELLGITPPYGDVEVIELAHTFLKTLKVDGKVTLELNTLGDDESRHAYKAALQNYLNPYKAELSQDSQVRLDKNPLRILDSKNAGDQKIVADAPAMRAYLTTNAQNIFDDVCGLLTSRGIAFHHNPQLVRGLDYYSHTAFEFTTDQLGAQATVLAGGRYDKLVEMMGGPSIPGIGWAAGIERLALLCDTELTKPRPITVLAADGHLESAAYEVTATLRAHGLGAEYIYPGGNMGKKLKRAARLNSRYCIIVGQTQWSTQHVVVRDLDEGTQVPTDTNRLVETLHAMTSTTSL